MKRKEIEALRGKSVSELKKEAMTLKKEISELLLNKKVNPPKDVNTLSKKRKIRAVVLTIQREKEIKDTTKFTN